MQAIICKSDDERLAFGWASVCIRVDGNEVIDGEQDTISPNELESAVYRYVLEYGDSGVSHLPSMRKVGKLVESCMFTKEKMAAMGIPEGTVPEGWWIGFRVEDDKTWEDIKSGILKCFSIEGTATRIVIEE